MRGCRMGKGLPSATRGHPPSGKKIARLAFPEPYAFIAYSTDKQEAGGKEPLMTAFPNRHRHLLDLCGCHLSWGMPITMGILVFVLLARHRHLCLGGAVLDHSRQIGKRLLYELLVPRSCRPAGHATPHLVTGSPPHGHVARPVRLAAGSPRVVGRRRCVVGASHGARPPQRWPARVCGAGQSAAQSHSGHLCGSMHVAAAHDVLTHRWRPARGRRTHG